MTLCELTEKDLGLGQSTTTTDGRNVDRQLFKEATFFFKKGALSFDEVRKAINVRKVHKNMMDRVVRIIKRLSIRDKTETSVVLAYIKVEEGKIAKKLFNKDYTCLDVAEHMKAMNELITGFEFKELSEIELPPQKGNREDPVLTEYKRGRMWLDYDKYK